MARTPTTTIRGSAVQIGTVLVFLGQMYRVTALEPYPNGLAPARIAWSGDWSMTVFDEGMVDVLPVEAEAVPAYPSTPDRHTDEPNLDIRHDDDALPCRACGRPATDPWVPA